MSGRKAETPFELCLGSLLVAGAFKFHCFVFRTQFFVVAQSAIGVVADANFCHCKQDDFLFAHRVFGCTFSFIANRTIPFGLHREQLMWLQEANVISLQTSKSRWMHRE